jgi:hypothetical protein
MAVDGVNIKGLDSRWEKDIYVPAYNSAAFAKAFEAQASAAAGVNSVRLVEAGRESISLTHAAQGQTYTLQLAHFPKNTELTLQLIGSQLVDGVAKQTAASIGTVTTDKTSAASLSWPVNARAGLYYVKAVDAMGGIFGMSLAIDIVGQDEPWPEVDTLSNADVQPALVDDTVVTTTTMDPNAAITTTETAKDPIVTPDAALSAATDAIAAATSGSDTPVLDAAAAASDELNGNDNTTPILDMADTATDAIVAATSGRP